jgi:hypothetical protein
MPERREMMNSGFDMGSEIAKLAEHILEPVAAKLALEEREPVAGQIRYAFGQLITRDAAADGDFESMALNILRPLQPKLSEAQFMRMVDRLRGAMVAFCQRNDWSQEVDVRGSAGK